MQKLSSIPNRRPLQLLIGPHKFEDEEFKSLANFNIGENCSLQEIEEHLPPDWSPDLFIWVSPKYHPIPEGIENAPFPTVAIVGDWNLGFTGLRKNLQRFDWVFTDRKGVEAFRRAGVAHVDYWPLFSTLPDIENPLDTEKLYDVTMIGNLNHDVQRERAPWLRRIARMNGRYKVRLLTDIYGGEYSRTLSQSKIVFNRSIRGEMNMRAFEAPACGSLLFFEEENLEARDFLEDRIHCVLYNKDNLEELVEYYLTHDEERERITVAGHHRIQQETKSHHFRLLLNLCEEHGVFESKASRSFPALTSAARSYYSGVNAFQRTKFSNAILQETERQFQAAADAAPESPWPKNALGALYGTYARFANDPAQKQELIGMSARQFSEALKLQGAAILHFNMAMLCLEGEQPALAKQELTRAATLLMNGDLSADQDALYLPRQYNFFCVDWERIAAEHVNEQPAEREEYRKLLLYQTCHCLGSYYLANNKHDQAVQCFAKAIETRPDLAGKQRGLLGQALEQLGRTDEALAHYRQGYREEPFDTELWKSYTALLQKQNLFDECETVCSDLINLIEACPVYEPILSWLQPRHDSLAKAKHAASELKPL